MEKQLFDWVDWSDVDVMVFIFDGITLIRQIGDFPIGSKFDSALVNYAAGTLRLCRGKTEYKFTLTFEVKPA